MAFDGRGQSREDADDGLPEFLRMIFGPSRLRKMRRRWFGGLGQDVPPEIDRDGAHPAGAEIEAGEKGLITQSLFLHSRRLYPRPASEAQRGEGRVRGMGIEDRSRCDSGSSFTPTCQLIDARQ